MYTVLIIPVIRTLLGVERYVLITDTLIMGVIVVVVVVVVVIVVVVVVVV